MRQRTATEIDNMNEHLNALIGNPATPYWLQKLATRVRYSGDRKLDVVDVINGLQALAEALDLDLKASRQSEYECFAPKPGLTRIQAAREKRKHTWRGIDWREVWKIKGNHGQDVVVFFKEDWKNPRTLTHYPGENTYARAEDYLRMANDANALITASKEGV